MKKILITGSKGQLGNDLKQCIDTSKYQPIFTDKEELDITDETQLFQFFNRLKIDYIINCAAYTAVDNAEKDEKTAYKINAEAPALIAEIASKQKIKLIHISTDYVFNGLSYTPYREENPTNPLSVYGKSKLKGEKAILNSGCQYVIIRTSWLYSSFGHNFVKTMMRLGNERKELNVVYDQIGTPTYAADLAQACIEIIQKTEQKQIEFKKGIYHFSNEGVCSWYDFAQNIMQYLNLDCKINPIETKNFPTPAKRPFYSLLNKEKIKQTFQIEIPYWHDSLIKCLNLINSN